MFKSKSSKLAISFLFILLFSALCAGWMAHPNHGMLVKYGPNNIGERNNTFEPPGFLDVYQGTERIHPLGTDGRGRDVASILIHGSKTSLLLGFFASLLSIVFGTILGIASAYYGNKTLKLHPLNILIVIITITLITFFAHEWSWVVTAKKLVFSYPRFVFYILVGCIFIFFSIKYLSTFLSRNISFPLDSIVMRFTEIFRAVPKLFLLLTVITFLKGQGLWTTTFLLGTLGWPRILRLVRGEVLEVKNQTFIINAQMMGLSDARIIWKHILPNILHLLLVSMAFLISGNILLESTLSFLGLGLPLDLPSWGGLLKQSREDFGAWWLAVFPGLTITFTLFSLNILAENYNNSAKKTI
ncbi:MAG: ABC transporter permease [Saprospiraceae bacterium]